MPVKISDLFLCILRIYKINLRGDRGFMAIYDVVNNEEQNFKKAPPLSATPETGKLRLRPRTKYSHFSGNTYVYSPFFQILWPYMVL